MQEKDRKVTNILTVHHPNNIFFSFKKKKERIYIDVVDKWWERSKERNV